MKRCPACNKKFPDGQNFCNVDGTRLVSIAAPPETPPAPVATDTPKTPIEQAPGWVDVILPTGEKIRTSLVAPTTTVGSSLDNHVVVNDPEVSRRHAVLQLQGENWYVTDVGSSNGTYLDRVRVGPEGRRINPGNTVFLGKSLLNITLASPVQAARSARPQAPEMPPPPVQISPPPVAPPPLPPAEKMPPQLRQAQSGGPPPTGKSLLADRYELGEVVARGSTSTVYRARRVLLGDTVAVKILNPELSRDRLALERFRRQAQVAARIRHPNSVQIYDYGVTPEGDVYLVEELLSGRTLRHLLYQERGLSVQRIVGIFNQICGAVHAAHLSGIVLRNINTETVFVERTPDGGEVIKVGGYGFAKIQSFAGDSRSGPTVVGQAKTLGKPQYMSPEQWMDKPLDSRSDVYSLGIILFELLTGEVPFDADAPLEVARMHLNSPVPDITKFSRREIDEGLATVVNRALAKDPERRQQTALQLAAELQAVSGGGAGLMRTVLQRVAGINALPQVVVPVPPAPVPAGEEVLPSVVAEAESKGRGALNSVVMALMAEAFLSRLSSGLIKTAVPVYALLVFGLDIASVMVLVLIQNIVPLLLRPYFGSLADRHGKKRVFMISLFIRTAVSVLYAVATLPMLFVISLVRGVADSAKGPSASAMIADHTDERNIAKAYSWYTTVKSTSGGIGEAVAAFLLAALLVYLAGTPTATVNVAVFESEGGKTREEILRTTDEVAAGDTLPGTEANPTPRTVLRVEQRELSARQIPIEDLPKVYDAELLRKVIVIIFIASTVLSFLSLLLVQIYIKEKREKKEKKKEKAKGAHAAAQQASQERQPNVWAFALMGALLTAPAYMVTGEFFTILAVKLEVTPGALGWIKLIAETLVPLLFGPFFGWLADRVGTGKVIALRSVSNLVTSALFWITPWFAGTALLGLMIGVARGIDEIGKAAFKPTWGAIAAKVSSFNLANRSRTMGIMEGGVDASDLTFPVLAGLLLQYLSLGPLMLIRGALAIIAEIYVVILSRKYKI